MTHTEEERLKELSQLIGQLREKLHQQVAEIEHLQEELEREKAYTQELSDANKQLHQKCELLLASRIIVAEEEDWTKARNRLKQIHKDIVKGISLLETE